jgi:iron(III) transport system substrate-binding protein|tara:strand:- start:198 stop:1220 length:1023 start_codon:yes stop_codon:yes gene_type:complete
MKKIILFISIFFTLIGISRADEVNIFSARHYDADVQLYEKFTAKTGILVNVVSGKDKALQKRIIEEGKDCTADLYITADAGRLGAFQAKGLFQKGASSTAIKKAVPANFRTAYWTGIAKRARIIYYSPERVRASDLKGLTYEGLADLKWKGKIVIRQSNNIYNQSLVASLIENNGKKKTVEWAKGLVSNMARDSKGNDRAQILAVAAGEADLAVANTYYLALMLSGKKGPEQQAAAKKVKPFFPNQDSRGTHMNISGGGILKYAPNKANAIKLLEFLLTKEAQEHIVNNTFEYPMIEGVEPHELVARMGLGFKQDFKTKVSSYGKKQADALEVMLEANWK